MRFRVPGQKGPFLLILLLAPLLFRESLAFHTVDREVPRSVSDAINSSARERVPESNVVERSVDECRERRFSNDRKSRECKVPGRTYRESVRILRSVACTADMDVYTGGDCCGILKWNPLHWGKRSGVDWYRVEILRIESGAIGCIFEIFFLNMITKLEN